MTPERLKEAFLARAADLLRTHDPNYDLDNPDLVWAIAQELQNVCEEALDNTGLSTERLKEITAWIAAEQAADPLRRAVDVELLAEVRRLLKLNATLEENRIAVQKRCTELLEELRDA